MKWRLLGVAIFAAALLTGFTMRDTQYRLDAKRTAFDQAALDHRDSAYTSMTWVASRSENYFQLRFFDKVEGGICLSPSWEDLAALAAKEPTLAHLVPTGGRPTMAEPNRTWPHTWRPDPGTLSNSPYVRLFPLSVLLNEKLVTDAGGDPRQAKPRILVVGLGSGAGIGVLAHHFPQASITVVDIDRKVIEMVRDHFPLIRWLSDQKRDDGEPRLRLEARDARQFIQFHDLARSKPFDVVILDAYTAGSTIPSHLMTTEFFADCARVLTPDGIVLANIIGSYGLPNGATGEIVGLKHRVLGGAIRSFRAAGLTSVLNFPVIRVWETPSNFNLKEGRNNIVVCSRKALEPAANKVAWERLKAFVPWPELQIGRHVTRQYYIGKAKEEDFLTAMVDAKIIDDAHPTLAKRLALSVPDKDALLGYSVSAIEDTSLVEQARRTVLDWAKTNGQKIPSHWDEQGGDKLVLIDTDWVKYARDTVRTSVIAGRDIDKHGGDALVGAVDWTDPKRASPNAIISDAPLFTDQRPNADILNR
ncbi:MAG: fused MFS/spermidine synthase [Planctomycetes bacterium]|nr:fused MFS/spermidine synthase [Planctomycetota bacterium]